MSRGGPATHSTTWRSSMAASEMSRVDGPRALSDHSRSPSRGCIRLARPAPRAKREVRVQPIEHRRGRCDALIVVACDRADAVDRAAHARGFLAAELVVAQIEVVDVLADRGERGVAQPHALDE